MRNFRNRNILGLKVNSKNNIKQSNSGVNMSTTQSNSENKFDKQFEFSKVINHLKYDLLMSENSDMSLSGLGQDISLYFWLLRGG